MKIELDTQANALYLQLVDEIRDGEAVITLELDEGVYLDLDENRRPLGLEFVDADDFLGFLRRAGGGLEITKGGLWPTSSSEQAESVVTADDAGEVVDMRQAGDEEIILPVFHEEIVTKRDAPEEGTETTRRRRRGRG